MHFSSLANWERIDQIFKILAAIIRLEDAYQKERIEASYLHLRAL